MSTDNEARKSRATDDQETSVLGSEPVAPPQTGAAVPGTLLNNRYLLVRQLNAGGFGTVHLAHDQQMHGRPVVVKIQIQQRVDDPWFERKFSEEVRALSLLDHPGVVVAFDSGRTPDGMPFLVMQYVEGATLRTVMAPEGMPLARVADILKQLGNALAAAHEKGIWHRDLKPENIMLQTSASGEDRVRLIDFGIATVADVQSKYQTSTRIAGSVLYMAPEQTMGQPTALTDIYAMGLIAYEMVTGRRPFPAESAIQMIAMQQHPVRVKPSDLRPSLPAEAERLILQCIEAEPAKRPQSARMLGDQLHNALLGMQPPTMATSGTFQIPPPPPPVSYPQFTAAPGTNQPPTVAEKPRRKKWGWAIAAMGIIWVIYSGRDKPKRTAEPRQPAAATSAAPSDEAIELVYWNSVKDSTDPQLFREYLSKYPDGEFASLANAKIQSLAKGIKSPPAPAPPPLGTDTTDSAIKQVAKAIGAGGNKFAELAVWEDVKDSDDPKPYQDYLAKYPDGMFATLATMKLAKLEKDAPQTQDPSSPAYRRKLTPPRDAVKLSQYNGPLEGDIHWKGKVVNNLGLTIQAGQVNVGEITGDLPRVPVTIEITSGQGTIIAVPAKKNQWDHLSVRNLSGKPMTSMTIHWKVNK